MAVKNLRGIQTLDSGAGSAHSVALKKDGTVWAWGENYAGQLGDATTTDRTMPVQVSGLSGIKAISVWYVHNLALNPTGRSGHGAATTSANWATAPTPAASRRYG